MRILLLNGPNLNLLGTREPEIYGRTTLPEVEEMCRAWATGLGHQLDAFQSNHEGGLIDAIQGAAGTIDGIVFNPGAYSHYSYAIADALDSVQIPTVEIHISNIRAREEFRRHSVLEAASTYQIFGRGVDGYRHAIRRLHHDAISPKTTHGDGHSDRVGDLRVPDGDGPHRVAVLVHGGFWRDVWTRDTIDSLAVDLHDRGYATWNIEYRRIPPVGAWRTTVGDVVDGLDALTHLAQDHPLDLSRVTVLGHSAGAHLAVMAAQRCQTSIQQLVLLGGVLDLSALPDEHDALGLLLGDEIDSHRDMVDPTTQAPIGVPSLVAHGTADDSVPHRHAEAFAAAAGDEATLMLLEGASHFDVVDASSSAWRDIAAQIG